LSIKNISIFFQLKLKIGWAPMAHTCSPTYSGGRDQEDGSWKPPKQIVHETLSLKTLHKNRIGGVAQGVSPQYKPSTAKKKKVKNKSNGRRLLNYSLLIHPYEVKSSGH
jgi:hypothetical protein